jgi:hypothetical protein
MISTSRNGSSVLPKFSQHTVRCARDFKGREVWNSAFAREHPRLRILEEAGNHLPASILLRRGQEGRVRLCPCQPSLPFILTLANSSQCATSRLSHKSTYAPPST